MSLKPEEPETAGLANDLVGIFVDFHLSEPSAHHHVLDRMADCLQDAHDSLDSLKPAELAAVTRELLRLARTFGLEVAAAYGAEHYSDLLRVPAPPPCLRSAYGEDSGSPWPGVTPSGGPAQRDTRSRILHLGR